MTNREKLIKMLLDTSNDENFARYFGCKLCAYTHDRENCRFNKCHDGINKYLEQEAEE